VGKSDMLITAEAQKRQYVWKA